MYMITYVYNVYDSILSEILTSFKDYFTFNINVLI